MLKRVLGGCCNAKQIDLSNVFPREAKLTKLSQYHHVCCAGRVNCAAERCVCEMTFAIMFRPIICIVPIEARCRRRSTPAHKWFEAPIAGVSGQRQLPLIEVKRAQKLDVITCFPATTRRRRVRVRLHDRLTRRLNLCARQY